MSINNNSTQSTDFITKCEFNYPQLCVFISFSANTFYSTYSFRVKIRAENCWKYFVTKWMKFNQKDNLSRKAHYLFKFKHKEIMNQLNTFRYLFSVAKFLFISAKVIIWLFKLWTVTNVNAFCFGFFLCGICAVMILILFRWTNEIVC